MTKKELMKIIQEVVRKEVKKEVLDLCSNFPIYNHLNKD